LLVVLIGSFAFYDTIFSSNSFGHELYSLPTTLYVYVYKAVCKYIDIYTQNVDHAQHNV